jgi:hypothetical protein
MGAVILLMVLTLPNGASGWVERLSFKHQTAKQSKP